MESCEKHLESKQKQTDGTFLPYYSKVAENTLEIVKDKIIDTIKKGLGNEYITKEEYEAMDPTEKGPGKFYEL